MKSLKFCWPQSKPGPYMTYFLGGWGVGVGQINRGFLIHGLYDGDLIPFEPTITTLLRQYLWMGGSSLGVGWGGMGGQLTPSPPARYGLNNLVFIWSYCAAQPYTTIRTLFRQAQPFKAREIPRPENLYSCPAPCTLHHHPKSPNTLYCSFEYLALNSLNLSSWIKCMNSWNDEMFTKW